MAELSKKQDAFCREYIIDLNATQAAIRAGYSAKTADVQGARLLVNVKVQKRIAELLEDRNKRVQIDSDYVLNRLVEIDQMDVIDILNDDGSLKPISQWPKVWRQFISGVDITEFGTADTAIGLVKKIKWPDKVRNLELLGKHTGVQAFKDRVELTGKDGGAIQTMDLTNLTDEQLTRLENIALSGGEERDTSGEV